MMHYNRRLTFLGNKYSQHSASPVASASRLEKNGVDLVVSVAQSQVGTGSAQSTQILDSKPKNFAYFGRLPDTRKGNWMVH